jgi:hypothetical protein
MQGAAVQIRVRRCYAGCSGANQGAAVHIRVRRGKAGYDVERRVWGC